MRIFVCKLRLHFPDSKHLRDFACHEIFGNFFSSFGYFRPPPPPPTIHASYGAESRTLIRRTNPAGNLVYQNTAHFIPLHSYSSELNYGRSAIIGFSSLTFFHNCSTLL
jgi:hypothetical protein